MSGLVWTVRPVPRWPPCGCRPAGLALRRVEEVVRSRSHQRIDRPLLPERPPFGRLCLAHVLGLVSMAVLVSAASAARMGVRLHTARRPPIGHGGPLSPTPRLARRGRMGRPRIAIPQATTRLKGDGLLLRPD